MKDFRHCLKRYTVQAKRKDTKEQWTEWSTTNDYNIAVRQAKRAQELGLDSKIIDGENKQND